MERNPNSGKWSRGGIEENILAILDAFETRDTQDANDDRIAFLEAVRAASVGEEHSTRPTCKIFKAVFRILKVGKSIELIVASYKLLIELEKAWSPFLFTSEHATSDKKAADIHLSGPLDSSSFLALIQCLAEVTDRGSFQALDVKSLANMLLFQYLVNFLEGDFLPRCATTSWNLQRESLLNMLLGYRKIYKGLMQDCLIVICNLCELHTGLRNHLRSIENSGPMLSKKYQPVAIALLEVGKNTCVSMQKFLMMIMELDILKRKADMEGYTTRADGVRTPLVEIILDELTYSKDTLSPFLQVFNEPKWKLEIIVQYFWKYITKTSVRTRKSNEYCDNATFAGVLKRFSNSTSTKTIIKKIGSEVVQLLLAHGFLAQLSLLSEGHPAEGISSPKEGSNSDLVDLCRNIISAFDSLITADKNVEILSVGKEAVFTAATFISY
ncbi:Negative regulator of systemic acquired resistance (SNI1) [Quillaja saponaria]|uniref:Negative regulator of systemic acquired resistance (SNI1) n=1 Tax=Quillaja saponaria TaxID=32244 RepID=A0AAD7M2M0_QUISA|nr:Negative regulator of systemic acquired resistance (SNI1) [Quillaja saponaria]